MSLLFDATTEQVDFGTLGSWSPTKSSFLWWEYPNSLSNDNNMIFSKGPNGERLDIRIKGDGDIQVFWGRATTDLVWRANSGLTINNWWFCAVTIDQGGAVNDMVRIYSGDLNTLATQNTDVTTTEGSGTFQDISTDIMRVGRFLGGLGANARIAVVAVFDEDLLTLGEIQSWQFNPRMMPNAILFSHLGYNGTGTQADWSGNSNNGTVTGATVADHVPLRPPFGFDLTPMIVGVVAGIIPQVMHHRQQIGVR